MMINESEIETVWSRQKKARIHGRFLKGPIPFTHLTAAAKLPGQALNVLLVTYHQTALTGKEWVTLPKGLLSDFGVSRDAKARALGHLQAIGVVTVQNEKGKPARVRLQESSTP
jgi:hypothetical protein